MKLSRPLPGSLRFATAAVDPAALSPLLVHPAAVRVGIDADGLTIRLRDGRAGPIRTVGPPPTGVDAAAWVASWINRFMRVHDMDNAPHTPETITAAQSGVLIVKPGTRPDEATLSCLTERIEEAGYRVVQTRLVPSAEILDERLVRRHYAAHWELAETGGLSVEEQARLLAIYQTPAFERATGHDAGLCEVAPAYAFARDHGIDTAEIAAWSRDAADAFGLNSGSIYGSNEVGDLAAVTMLHATSFYDGPPVFLINPHMLTVAQWYESATRPVAALHIAAAQGGSIGWSRLRHEVCGTSDPATAWPGSLRRDIGEGIFPMTYEEGVGASRLRNAVHLSNGPIEAVRELAIWFGLRPRDTAMGRALADASGWSEEQLLGATHCRIDGADRVLVEATNGLSVAEAAAVLRACTPGSKRVSNRATFERLAIARRAAAGLRADPGVQAVLVSGSVARGRCSADSDVDLIVLCDAPVSRIDRSVERGVTVEAAFSFTGDVLDEVGRPQGSMQELKRASRFGHALPLYDPAGLHRTIATAAAAMRPDDDERNDLLAAATDALRDLHAAIAGNAAPDGAQARSLCDTLCYLLLSASPIRYQKPKWVVDDLRLLDEHAALELLARHYRLGDQAAVVAATVDACEGIIIRVAARLGLPSFAAAREAGLIADAPEYSFLCQCLTDARGLLADGHAPDADYAAKFAGKMALCLLDEAGVDAASCVDIADDYARLFAGGEDGAAIASSLTAFDTLLARCAKS